MVGNTKIKISVLQRRSMTERDMLERVALAYKAYPYPNKDIEAFVAWLYQQYGIVPNDKK